MFFRKISLALITLLQIHKAFTEGFQYSVSVLPSEYGGTKVGVVIDNAPPVALSPLFNGFLWRGSGNKPTASYYYAILDANDKVVASEAKIVVDPTLGGTENLSFQREAPKDNKATSTLNEIYGAKYTIGDSIIKGIPRLFPKHDAYNKYSLLFQEGQIPNIRAECSDVNYNNLITSLEQELSLINCTMTFISPYEELFFPDITLSIAGMGSRGFKKRPFKVEITEFSDESMDIYNRNKFKLRNMVYDCTYIKNKLATDLGTSLSTVSGQDGFARFYVNNQPFGLYDLFDPLKKKFIKQYFHYGEEDPQLGVLFKCKTNGGIRYFMEIVPNLSAIYTVDIVPDGADELTYTGEEDIMGLLNFINQEMDTATVERIKEVIDVDLLLKTFIIEYLVDHRDGLLIGGNNFNIYKNYQTGRYHIWSYDFDATFGKFQTYPTTTTFEQYMKIPPSYFDNRPAGEPRPQVNPLAQKLFAKPEIKQEFDKLLLDVTSKVFNPQGLNPRIQYFEEFLKHHMYWDVSQSAKLPTQHFQGVDADPAFTLPLIQSGYNGKGNQCSGDAESLLDYISIRSQTTLTAAGGTVQTADVSTISEDDLVGLPISSLTDDEKSSKKSKRDNVNQSNSSSDASSYIRTFTYSILVSIVLIFLIY